MKHKVSSILSLMLLSILVPLSAEEPQGIEVRLSEVELQEIFSNPDRTYVYVGPGTNIGAIVQELSKFDNNPNSLVRGLAEHIQKGFVIGRYDAIAQALEESEQVLIQNETSMDADNAAVVAQALNIVVEQVIDDKLTLDASKLAFLKDSIALPEDANKSCCTPHTNNLRLLVVKQKVDFLGKAKFKEDVIFYDDVKFKDEVKFKDAVTFDGDVTFEGPLSATDAVIQNLSVTDLVVLSCVDNLCVNTLSATDIFSSTLSLCDLTVDCNINMNNSISPSVGNIFKAGAPFMHNYGVNSTFLGTGAGNFSIPTGVDNTGIGTNALSVNTTGASNTAVGARALELNVIGEQNTAVGTNALEANISDDNTAVGFNALVSNTTGVSNVAVGVNALSSNTTGTSNTGVGAGALLGNTAGTVNTAVGFVALNANTTGDSNTGLGSLALQLNTIGSNNTAVGSLALQNNTTGVNNVALGVSALAANTIGTGNTALGTSALDSSTGSDNIAIGINAGVSLTTGNGNIYVANAGVAAESTTTRIGTAQTSCFISGIRGITTGVANAIPVLIDSNGQLGTTSSSIRFKDNVQDMANASANIYGLRPVTFTYKSDVTNTTQYGLIAEEVAQTFPQIVVYEDGQPYSVEYNVLPQLLLNELQKLAVRVTALEAR